MDKVFSFLGDNKRITAIGVAVVALLIAFGFDSSQVSSIVAAIVGLVLALFASNSDSMRAVDKAMGEEPEPQD